MDDILFATKTMDKNLSILKEVLELIVDNLELKIDKCSFLKIQLDYLGYEISHEGIKPSKSGVNAVLQFPVTKNLKELHSFLGLASYFRKYIPKFSLKVKPLYNIIKSKSFHMKQEHLLIFDWLKEQLSVQPILSIYSPKADTELHCDASKLGFGSILFQKQSDGKNHPVFYFSKRTTDVESCYHSYELKCLAIIYAIKRFHVYLSHIPFKIVTYCNSIKLTLHKKDIVPRIMRWAMFLEEYNYTIVHRENKHMQHVDALSRINSGVLILEENMFEQNLSIT